MAWVDRDLVLMMEDVFADARTARLSQSERCVAMDTALWKELSALGLTRLTGSEEAGGSGAGWPEAAALLAAAARHAVHLPLAESDLLAGWLLERAGLPCDDAARTACVLDAHGRSDAVPWARDASCVVVVWATTDGWRVADVPAPQIQVTPCGVLGGGPLDTVTVDAGDLAGAAVDDNTIRLLRLRGGLARSVQMCAAMDRILELCIEHVATRRQFGRSLARFQSVQNLVVDIAAEASLARVATEAAVTRMASTPDDVASLNLAVATARSCAGHAASVVVRNAHQVHGAIGTTIEHQLHEFTLPVLAWRSEFGSLAEWDAVLADAAVAAGRDVWPLVAGS